VIRRERRLQKGGLGEGQGKPLPYIFNPIGEKVLIRSEGGTFGRLAKEKGRAQEWIDVGGRRRKSGERGSASRNRSYSRGSNKRERGSKGFN